MTRRRALIPADDDIHELVAAAILEDAEAANRRPRFGMRVDHFDGQHWAIAVRVDDGRGYRWRTQATSIEAAEPMAREWISEMLEIPTDGFDLDIEIEGKPDDATARRRRHEALERRATTAARYEAALDDFVRCVEAGDDPGARAAARECARHAPIPEPGGGGFVTDMASAAGVEYGYAQRYLEAELALDGIRKHWTTSTIRGSTEAEAEAELIGLIGRAEARGVTIEDVADAARLSVDEVRELGERPDP